jgi:hypothetical protein
MSFNVYLSSDQPPVLEHERTALIAARAVLDLHRFIQAGDLDGATARFGLDTVAQLVSGDAERAYWAVARDAIDGAPTPTFGRAPLADREAHMLAVLLIDKIDDLSYEYAAANAISKHPELVVTAMLLDQDPVPRVTVNKARTRSSEPAAEQAR